MCEFVMTSLAAMGSKLAATAAGAVSGAATTGLGTALSVGGALYQGISAYQAGKAQASAIGEQMATEAQLTAVKDARTRQQFRSAMREQAAELAARGVALDSPTAVFLGQTAAKELSFESQAIRSDGSATQTELSAARRIAVGRARSGLLQGAFSATGRLLGAAPELWPELGQ